MRKVPPIKPDQNVYVLDRLKEKSNTRSRPASPARCRAWVGESGILMSSVMTTASSAPTIRNICLTSTHVTACTPPTIVYRIAGTPISATHHQRFHPKIAENTTAGAAMIVPHDIARETRKRNAVSD